MVEYIERDAAIEVALSCTDSFEPIEVDATVESIVSKLRKLPIADVQPVKHGRWEERDCGFDVECKCSVCGYKDFIPTKHDRYWFNRNYCPNCGARMDGEDDG